MRIARAAHPWRVTPSRAVEIQRSLRDRVVVRRIKPARPLRFAVGVDAAYSADESLCLAAAVRWDLDAGVVLDELACDRTITAPYVPGLLSFREAPAVLDVLRKVPEPVDVILVDGHGLAHPRRFGLACHVGVLCERPTLGCAKSLLIGTHRSLGSRRGARQLLKDGGECVGAVVRTREGVKPVYVSVGHLLDLETAVDVVLGAAVRYRIPEPLRLADRLAQSRKRLLGGAAPPW